MKKGQSRKRSRSRDKEIDSESSSLKKILKKNDSEYKRKGLVKQVISETGYLKSYSELCQEYLSLLKNKNKM